MDRVVAKPPPEQQTPATSTMTNAGDQFGAATDMTKLSEALTKYQEAATKVQEEKGDVRQKAWNRLPQIQRNIILLGGIDEDNEIPTNPTEEMLVILGCQNGAQVDQYLKQVMAGYNVSFEPGLCSAINKGIMVHADDGSLPKNYSCFLTPPMKDDIDVEESNAILKLAVQSKYTEDDVTPLTKMQISILMNVQDLRQHVKNISGLTKKCFGENAIMTQSLKDLENHTYQNKMRYTYESRQDSLFGGDLLGKVH